MEKKVEWPLNERIHVSLTDHIAFALKRLQQGMNIINPFLTEGYLARCKKSDGR